MTISSRHQCPECNGFDWEANSDSSLDYHYQCNNDSCETQFTRLLDAKDHEVTEEFKTMIGLIALGMDPEQASDYYQVEKAGIPPIDMAQIRDCSLTTVTENIELAREFLRQWAGEGGDPV